LIEIKLPKQKEQNAFTNITKIIIIIKITTTQPLLEQYTCLDNQRPKLQYKKQPYGNRNLIIIIIIIIIKEIERTQNLSNPTQFWGPL